MVRRLGERFRQAIVRTPSEPRGGHIASLVDPQHSLGRDDLAAVIEAMDRRELADPGDAGPIAGWWNDTASDADDI